MFETYLEIGRGGPYKEDVIDLLENEVVESLEICKKNKKRLQELLEHVRSDKGNRNEAAIKEIGDILMKYPGFKKTFARYVADRMLGKR